MGYEEPAYERIIATFRFNKRRFTYRYQSEILRYYRPYLVYYKKLPSKEMLEKLPEVEGFSRNEVERKTGREELIKIPVRGIDIVVNYAKNLNADIEYVMRYLPKLGYSVKIPVIVFQDRYSAMRHLIFSLTYATLRSITKVEKLKEVINGLNINIIEPFYNTALFRYYELRSNGDPAWYWKVLRIGRAFKVMYMLDR